VGAPINSYKPFGAFDVSFNFVVIRQGTRPQTEQQCQYKQEEPSRPDQNQLVNPYRFLRSFFYLRFSDGRQY
jgi:hypothetical protein